ncbi:MAG: RidA family protein [Actinobacteria bacterium]|nr:RidA family protein [Actinomycetota bacterium]
MKVEEKIKQLGLKIPDVPKPDANYIPARRVGNIIYISGQGCDINEMSSIKGRVGEFVSEEEGYNAAKFAVLNCLAVLKSEIKSLDKVKKVVYLRGYICSSSSYNNQHKVLNGASDLLIDIFGEKGKHARCAIGVNSLPNGIPVEIEMIVEVEE